MPEIWAASGYSNPLEKFKGLEEPEEQRPESVGYGDTLKAIVSALCLCKKEEAFWMRKINHTHSCPREFGLALLLLASFKVDKAVLKVEPGFNTHYLERMIQKVACGEMPLDIQPPFQNLTVLLYYPQDVSHTRITGFIAPLLKLAAIREISARLKNTWGDRSLDDVTDGNLTEQDSRSSPVTHLDLAVHGLSRKDLSLMLRAPKALNSFSYNFCTPSLLSFTHVRDALGPRRNCLESLELDDGGNDESSLSTWISDLLGVNRAWEPLPSFVSFNDLKVFKLAAPFLQETENGIGRHSLINIFPPNLETNHLNRFQAYFEARVRSFGASPSSELSKADSLVGETGPGGRDLVF